MLDDGRTIEVCVEVDQWSASLKGDPQRQVAGFPLESILMEVIGLNPAHDETFSVAMPVNYPDCAPPKIR